MSAVRGAVSACRRRRLPDEKGIETLYNKTVDTYPPVEWRRRLPDEKGIETATRIVARRRCDMAAPRDHDPQTVRGISPPRGPLTLYWRRTMTIDERLEALTQSLELIAHMQQAEEKRAAERDAKTDQRISRILDVVEKQAGNIDKLAAVPHDHQPRSEPLKSKPSQTRQSLLIGEAMNFSTT